MIEQVIEELKANFQNAHVDIQSDGSHFNVLIVSDDFIGVRPVKKQQMVYAILNPHIASGAMHAVNMRLLTQSEWSESQS